MEVLFEPDNLRVTIDEPVSLLEVAAQAGIALEAICGGKGLCGKCKVRITGRATKPTDTERKLLTAEELEKGFRLACQTLVKSDIIIEIPAGVQILQPKLLVSSVQKSVPVQPDITKVYLELPVPKISDQRADLDRIIDSLKLDKRASEVDLEVIRRLPAKLRRSNFKITAVLANHRLIGLEEGDTRKNNYGIAFDIGTSTVAGYLLDLNSGEVLSVGARVNPQVRYGEDVISRINFTMTRKDGLKRLCERAISVVNDIIDEVTNVAGVDKNTVYELTVVGNTCMTHLFLGIDPRNLSLAPYVGVFRDTIEARANELGIRINPGGYVKVLPNIAGFVGADCVGVVLATGIDQADKLRMAIDIGTNSEIIMGSSNRLLATSCAAGPAFEGARITHGMRAAAGAIDRVEVTDDDIIIRTVGNSTPRGICGSGLVDVVAQLLRVGVVDPSGRLVTRNNGVPSKAKARISATQEGHQFVLVDGTKTYNGQPIVLTQRDIRELQLAKAALRAGISILLKELGIKIDEISDISLAGAFGNYIRKESALVVGLIPDFPIDRIKSVGNAAGEGARLALLSTEFYHRAQKISEKVEYIELAGRADFQTQFAQAMFFPGG